MRPKQAEKRLRVGDCEGDFIVSGKSGKGVLLVVVCRKLRMAFLENIFPVTVDAVHIAFLRIQKRFPEMRTLTLDNDILFQMHLVLEKLLGLKIYFCHPYHSWEKGSVENTNRYIRKFLPKGTDLSRVDKKEIREIEKYLNARWMECLSHASPAEELVLYRKKQKNSLQKLQKRSKL
jgi:IS30 family transposase